MIHILLPAAVAALMTTVLAAGVEEGLVFRASFDSTLEAEVGAGDRKLYWSGKMELPPKTSAPGLPSSAVIRSAKEIQKGFSASSRPWRAPAERWANM